MIETLKESSVLRAPFLHTAARDGLHLFLDPEAPNWAATDARGAELLAWADGKTPDDLCRLYAQRHALGGARSWRDVHDFLNQAARLGLLGTERFRRAAYRGRAEHLTPALRELWIHLLQTCNLSCTHCLVSSGPGGEAGPSTAFVRSKLDEAHALGVRRFYFTGGEPFARADVFELIEHVTRALGSELIVLTNGTLLEGERLRSLARADRARVKLQVSLDGAAAPAHDAIRGAGTFAKAAQGLKAAAGLGFEATLTAVVTRGNLAELERLPALAAELGAKAVHLLWLHKRGRILETGGEASFPSTAELTALARRVRRAARDGGVRFDNADSLARRANGQPNVKYDLGNLCWETLCLYVDGRVYPSAAMAGQPGLALGDASGRTLESLWRESAVARAFREASVAEHPSLSRHPFRFLTGGGDMEHAYFFSANGREGSVLGLDPYHDLYVELLQDEMFELAARGRAALGEGAQPGPRFFHAMGEGALQCSDDAAEWLDGKAKAAVRLGHSNCVLSFDVERPYRLLQAFYGDAAVEPKAELCCPVRYDDAEVGHIPREVLERFYGCGSPVSAANLAAGETMLDLGSGAGIDCFIAAKQVGAQGKVIGVDMTDEMLRVARECAPKVAGALGYDATEFRKGFLERIPAEDGTVDLVTSNCVINLSPDKGKVFAEIRRVLKEHGRAVVADIVSEKPVPLALQAHRALWGECISGSLSEDEFMAGLERAGFHGLQVLKRTFWKEVEGHRFHSITVRAFKAPRGPDPQAGQRAVYLGPFKAVTDDEGRLFPRYEAVEVGARTAAKLARAPYAGQFLLLASGTPLPLAVAGDCCAPSGCS
ncbi:MAG: methyltransferase domain-containing protein [Elusimicrobia bacterium]|nr:methyltransferase domain-containing protein [Elusimicrobiota bacterium]